MRIEINDEDIFNIKIAIDKLRETAIAYIDLEVLTLISIVKEYEDAKYREETKLTQSSWDKLLVGGYEEATEIPQEVWVNLKVPKYEDGVPCSHPGCLSHISHPCEGCGRINGRYPLAK